jgi:hypothetical protein
MRIGWSIPLGGPFRLSGTVWRSKSRRRGYHGALQNPRWTCPHNHSRPDLAQACAEREARRRAPALAAQRAAADETQHRATVITDAIDSLERLVSDTDLATASRDDLRACRASLSELETGIDLTFTGGARRKARRRVSALGQRLDDALTV